MSRKTGIVKDLRYLRHDAGFGHPESPKRLGATYAMLESPDMVGRFVEIAPRHATHEEIGLIHSQSYIDFVASTAGQSFVALDPDTAATPESYDVAKLAVGGLCNAIDMVVTGEIENAFALVRPPGHHAGVSNAAGFCLFNNVAIGAMYAHKKYHVDKILIVDWDLHHGNGTQAQFYDDPRVLYFSTHQYPYYPGTGSIEEIGRGKGLGYTINVPLRPGTDDAQYVKIFTKVVHPVSMKFEPQMVLLSAGFDPYFKDPLGGMRVTPEGFAYMTRILMNIADACCGGKFVVTLEGGYHITGLAESIKLVLKEMRDDTHVQNDVLECIERDADSRIDPVLKRVMDQVNPIWRVF
ncbi:MAG: histone deacetylase [Deltaproteobacteria bacterium]|nr:histone deacetylase [Deltaproteobacteria bacterium]